MSKDELIEDILDVINSENSGLGLAQRLSEIEKIANYYRKEEPIEIDPTFTEECIFETDKYCFVASRIKKDDGTFHDDISVTVTDKQFPSRDDWTEEHWDNMNWFRGILNNNPESMPEFIESVHDYREQQVFIQMLNKLIELGWFKLDKDE
jgi:hypothetical protein